MNDVKVDADDGGGPSRSQGDSGPRNAAPEHGRAHGATGSHGRPSRSSHSRPDSRPGTGADSSFADADDPALPPEAAEAIKEADELQHSAGQAAGQGNGQSNNQGNNQGNGRPNTAPNSPQQGSPQQGSPQQGSGPEGATGAAPAQPRGTSRGATRPQGPISDRNTNNRSTNKTSGRRPGRARVPQQMPVAFFSSSPATQGSRLVLHTSAGNAPARTVTLQCYPTGGTHPKAAQACADVARAGGNLAQMPANTKPQACFMIYSPVTVTAQGQWHGQAVRYTKKFPNSCVMRDKTGSVFDF
ncbi:hypothetical protein GCM10023191_013650 [Actinoallomurus oryzae]|uniref:Subtilisin inhibitor domain-containing protein n=1 Tax=Actinoallomurus oryzae TaxID=502180 RepID=A0ABP8PF20_9ACTN